MYHNAEGNLISVPGKQLFVAVEELLHAGATFKLVVTGNSMYPFLKHKRDSVILTGIAGYTLKRGDIVLVRRNPESHVLHRVYKLRSGGFIMNGDAQNWDEFIPSGQVIAVAGSIERKGRLISCDNRIYRLASKLWMLLRPFRRPLFRGAGALVRVCRRLFRKLCKL